MARVATHQDLLEALREIEGINEKTHAHFYRKRQAFLHFHGDEADVKVNGAWQRVPVGTARDRVALVRLVEGVLAGG